MKILTLLEPFISSEINPRLKYAMLWTQQVQLIVNLVQRTNRIFRNTFTHQINVCSWTTITIIKLTWFSKKKTLKGTLSFNEYFNNLNEGLCDVRSHIHECHHTSQMSKYPEELFIFQKPFNLKYFISVILEHIILL